MASRSALPIARCLPPTSRRLPRPALRSTTPLLRSSPPAAKRFYAATPPETAAPLRKTPLFDFHKKHTAKIVPFAGYEMPLNYEKNAGQVNEHNAVRKGCGLFDVSHMVQHVFSGPSATAFLSRLLPSPLDGMTRSSSSLSVLLNDQGGIIDDCMVTSWGDEGWYLVTNAGRRDEDLAWIEKQLAGFDDKDSVEWKVLDGWGLVALQGPKASSILQPLLDDPAPQLDKDLFFGQSLFASISGVKLHIARGGYTGEDGFEISIPPSESVRVTDILAEQEGVTLCGLAARDSLRLEAGLCLYGHDLDESVGTGEAALGWVVGKQRTGFIGEDRTRKEVKDAIKRRRVGLVVEKGAPAREGAKIVAGEGGEEVGVVTSGIPSPTVGKNIAMGYVKSGWHKKGTELKVVVRGKERKAEVVKMPFVEAKYFRG